MAVNLSRDFDDSTGRTIKPEGVLNIEGSVSAIVLKADDMLHEPNRPLKLYSLKAEILGPAVKVVSFSDVISKQWLPHKTQAYLEDILTKRVQS